MTFKNRAIIRQ